MIAITFTHNLALGTVHIHFQIKKLWEKNEEIKYLVAQQIIICQKNTLAGLQETGTGFCGLVKQNIGSQGIRQFVR